MPAEGKKPDERPFPRVEKTPNELINVKYCEYFFGFVEV